MICVRCLAVHSSALLLRFMFFLCSGQVKSNEAAGNSILRRREALKPDDENITDMKRSVSKTTLREMKSFASRATLKESSQR
ncbi:hypothetical protein BaRGS_00018713 [Batillaria attramentaria]|uniref:Secreted protein n=1 Tax=Batillaria attramentaria TaxID=370345 RepID=A0ABD0KRW5_9CAEN